ncbi:hypothetical protein CY35_08G110100 [Sphagnum magellanicum]|nr:hypothetical protein CY35_08G110100 [Sphagnum magellanicum]
MRGSQACEVHKLSLMENFLTTLNGVTFSAPKLEVLLARNEMLEAMPKQFLKGIENLKVLDLSTCVKLISLPREIGNLRQSTHLDLHKCVNLISLPKEIGKLTQLTHLNLHYCGMLKFFPKEVGKLTQLIYLDLSICNYLEKLPKSIGHLQSLRWLDLSCCFNLKYLPSTMGDLRSLQYLNLDGPSTKGLWGKPSWKLYGQAFGVDICKLIALIEFHIFGETCEIVELCDQLLKLVSKLVKLKSLVIRDFHKLETLLDAIQSMVCLEKISVIDCEWIKILPSVIILFLELKELRSDRMSSLESLPTLNTLKILSTLSISGCKSTTKLPNSFTSLDAFASLKELFGFLEVEDGAMPKLQILNLNDTNIKSLPNTLIYLKNLKVVYICHNGFYDSCKKFKNIWLSGKFF